MSRPLVDRCSWVSVTHSLAAARILSQLYMLQQDSAEAARWLKDATHYLDESKRLQLPFGETFHGPVAHTGAITHLCFRGTAAAGI